MSKNLHISKLITFELTDLGHLHYYLNIHFIIVEGGIFLSERKYIEKLLQRFRFEECKAISTRVEVVFKLSYQDKGEPTDVLLIILYNTRPDIDYAISQLRRCWHKRLTPSTLYRKCEHVLELGLEYISPTLTL